MVSKSQKRQRRDKRRRPADPNQGARENQRIRYCSLGLHKPLDPHTYDPPALREVTINSVRDGSDEWDFRKFEQDPYEALLLHHLNRGITQFNFSDEDELIEDIRSEALTKDEVEEMRTIFQEYRHIFRMPTCAVCGIRDPYRQNYSIIPLDRLQILKYTDIETLVK